ncbi:MAG: ARPP-1 family domain-containing protein [Candidatus Krumholzibacteriia bacterium]
MPERNARPDENPYTWPAVRLEPPCTSGALTVFPILNGHGGGGDYILLANAVEQEIASVSEVSDKGNIPVIVIENRSDTPLLGVQGEEYVGAKQNRTLNISVLAGPGTTRIPVTCVEQGRWDAGATGFSAGAYETMGVRAMKSAQIGKSKQSVKDAFRRYFTDQGMVWNKVRAASMLHNVDSPTGAMHRIYESDHVRKPLDELISGIEVPEGTRGVVVAIGGRLVAVELFEHGKVFARIWPRILRSYALSALHAKKRVPPSVETAESFVSRPRKGAWNATPSVGMGEDVRWDEKDFVASALVWKDRFLHATMFSRDAA